MVQPFVRYPEDIISKKKSLPLLFPWLHIILPRVLVNNETSSVVFVCLFVCFFHSMMNVRHMEVPRLGVEPELQLLAYTTATATPYP